MICITESWLNSNFFDAELCNSRFQLFRRDRHLDLMDAPVGGGIVCAVKAELPCSLLDVPNTHDLEFLCVSLSLSSKLLFIITVYCPPKSPLETYEKFIKAMEYVMDIMRPSDDVLILGDFNFPDLIWTYDDSEDYLTSIGSSCQEIHVLDNTSGLNLQQINHIRNRRHRILDLVFSTDACNTLISHCDCPLVPEDKHHPSLIVNFNILIDDSDRVFENNFSFNFKKADFSALNNYFTNCDWTEVINANNVDDATSLFYTLLFKGFSNTVPYSCQKKILLLALLGTMMS